MTDNEADILARLQKGIVAVEGMKIGPGEVAYAAAPWRNAADVGGSNASHHSTTLRRMAEPAKAWVEVMKVAARHNRYRITDKGVQALANHTLLKGKP